MGGRDGGVGVSGERLHVMATALGCCGGQGAGRGRASVPTRGCARSPMAQCQDVSTGWKGTLFLSPGSSLCTQPCTLGKGR